MDESRRQVILTRKGMLIAQVRRLDREKQDRIREVTSSPTFDPFNHTFDSRVASLISEQQRLIAEIAELDRVLNDAD